jgi:CheY-like chemotaxis protein
MEIGFQYSKVMVIDDSKVDRYIAEKLLSSDGFAAEVISCESAIEALCYLRPIRQKEHVPELIFLDIRMPEIDGFEFLDLYCGLSDIVKKNAKIIMVSSSHDQRDQQRADSNQYVCCFIAKPLHKEKLIGIQQMLQAV